MALVSHLDKLIYNFGFSKLISKPQSLQVDNWTTKHLENKTTGGHDLIETYEGKIEMEKTDEYKYGSAYP